MRNNWLPRKPKKAQKCKKCHGTGKIEISAPDYYHGVKLIPCTACGNRGFK